ncbi:peptidoglycan recognition protein family protein [Phycisphaera mikurensis]|uniref:Putative N-acetylmuramoyl-L-alanine amidase n=1 Tax=Phycisphaera mikurensis (strain NBRC 102666 / KCTC 22515 / FYK2301M01) TaxID=1142394 RepID=I0IDV6_PHYMF|nr:peptidoglycan recognition family protein [Phycisphaera mikurensis]MBB6441252.1 hypothetical protein [Phycisphaera mikurensis]BAM03444.1 putative N-acetylmuramoyl-L-alanine amidase [Phycisphaera mikurensis NBRC 102666]
MPDAPARWLLPALLLVAPAVLAEPAPAPSIVMRERWGGEEVEYPEALRHEPATVLLHHAGVAWRAGADPAASMRGLLRFSREEKGWPDVPYHFVVAPDGRIFEGRDLRYAPDTNTSFDPTGYVNVELLGNFEEQRVNATQLDAAVRVVAWLADRLEMPTADLATHAGVAPGQTSCPGADFLRYLDGGSFHAAVDAARAGEPVEIEVLPPLPDGPQAFAEAEEPAVPKRSAN